MIDVSTRYANVTSIITNCNTMTASCYWCHTYEISIKCQIFFFFVPLFVLIFRVFTFGNCLISVKKFFFVCISFFICYSVSFFINQKFCSMVITLRWFRIIVELTLNSIELFIEWKIVNRSTFFPPNFCSFNLISEQLK